MGRSANDSVCMADEGEDHSERTTATEDDENSSYKTER